MSSDRRKFVDDRMNRHVYNASLTAGWALVSTGTCLWSLPVGLVTSGALLLALTVGSAVLAARSAR